MSRGRWSCGLTSVCLCSLALNDIHVIRKLNVKRRQRRFPMKRRVLSVWLSAHVAQNSILDAACDGVLEAFRIEQPWKLWSCEKGVANSPCTPLLKCRRPIPSKEVRAYAVL